MNGDPLEWLLPDSGAHERAELCRVVQALRLLRTELARPGSRSVAPPWPRLFGEFAELARREAVRALEVVLAAHLCALRPADSFLPVPPPRFALDEAWRILLARRLCAPTPPSQSLVAAARELVACGRALGTPDFWGEYWELALLHVESGAARGRWARALARVRAARARPSVLARFVGGLAACELERGEPARALLLLRAHAPLFALAPELARLHHWSAVALGLPQPSEFPAPAELPLPLVELARDDPRYAELLGGPAQPGEARTTGAERPARATGASVVVLWRCVPAQVPEVRSCRLPVEARPRLARAARTAQLGEAAASARMHVERRGPRESGGLPDALGGARTRARAFVPVRTADGAFLVWQIEWPHVLLPGPAWFEALGAGAARAVLPAARGAPDPRAEVLRSLERRLVQLGLERFALCTRGAEPACLFERGLGRRGRKLARSHAEPGGGFTLVELGRIGRLFVAGEIDRPRVERSLAALVEPFLAASFRAHEVAQGRADPCWDPEAPVLRATRTLDALGPWEVWGAPGSGRRLMARWILFRAGLDPEETGRVVQGEGATGKGGTVRVRAGTPAALVAGRGLFVPPLAARRAELPLLLLHCARRIGGVGERALGSLWRQDWSGGWPELERVLARLARNSDAAGEGSVRAALLEMGLVFRSRRDALEPEELTTLLAATRHRSGNLNLARAARWVGWRPSALARQLAALRKK